MASRRLASTACGSGLAACAALAAIRPRVRPQGIRTEEDGAERGDSRRRSCVVVGSGVVGLATAYYIQRSGAFDAIHVVDRHKDCALGASFQNGGVINVEAIAPLNSYMSLPSTFKQSLLCTFGFGSTNTLITWRALLEPPGLLLRWVWYFYKNSDEESIQRNAAKMLEMGSASSQLFEEVARHLGLDEKSCNFSRTPGLVLSHVADPEAAVQAKQNRFGSVKQKKYVLDGKLDSVKKDCGLVGLAPFNYNLGCVEPDNLTINTRTFCQSLAKHLQSQGVMIHFSDAVEQIVTCGSTVEAVALASGCRLPTDCLVLCAGYETCYLLKRLGVSLPLAPVKAYSLHIKDAEVASKLKYATHLDADVACLITPYFDSQPPAVRVTGIRDLDGFNESTRPDRAAALIEVARHFVGLDFNEQDVAIWSGVMAVSPDDFPIVGGLQRFGNLFVNTGHGFRGTNWSVATAKLLSQLVAQDSETCIDSASTSPARFGI